MLIAHDNNSNSTVLLFNILTMLKAFITHILSLDICNSLPKIQKEKTENEIEVKRLSFGNTMNRWQR